MSYYGLSVLIGEVRSHFRTQMPAQTAGESISLVVSVRGAAHPSQFRPDHCLTGT